MIASLLPYMVYSKMSDREEDKQEENLCQLFQ